MELVHKFPNEAGAPAQRRPLLATALEDAHRDDLAAAPDAEVRAGMTKDHAYWEPLKRELGTMRLTEARQNRPPV